MGWTFYATNRAALIADLTKPWENDTVRAETLRHCCVGNVLWAVEQRFRGDVAEEPVILCFLMQKDDGRWGYKDMTEAMGPYYWTCPLAYLDLAPETNAQWRVKVRETANTRAAKQQATRAARKRRRDEARTGAAHRDAKRVQVTCTEEGQ